MTQSNILNELLQNQIDSLTRHAGEGLTPSPRFSYKGRIFNALDKVRSHNGRKSEL
jgi:hypothetical protein